MKVKLQLWLNKSFCSIKNLRLYVFGTIYIVDGRVIIIIIFFLRRFPFDLNENSRILGSCASQV